MANMAFGSYGSAALKYCPAQRVLFFPYTEVYHELAEVKEKLQASSAELQSKSQLDTASTIWAKDINMVRVMLQGC